MSKLMTSPKRVEVLDYLRGAAIFSVLMAHCLFTAYGGTLLPWQGWFRSFSVRPSFLVLFPFSLGTAGVAIFFIVSGFCIHASYSQSRNWRNFYISRFFRIYPPYFVAMLAFAFLFPRWVGHLSFNDDKDWQQLFTHLLLVHNWSPQYLGGINGSFWSLAIEVQLYLIYPLLLWLVARFDWRNTMFMVAAIEILLRMGTSIAECSGQTDAAWAKLWWHAAYSPFGYWCSWALGAWIGDAYLNNRPLPLLKQPLTPWLVLTVASDLVKPLESFFFLLAAVSVAIATSKLLNGSRPGFPVPAFVRNFFKQLGEWSYGIYLVHQPLLYLVFYPAMGWISFISVSFSDYVSQPPYMNQYGLIFRFLIALILLLIVIPLGVLWFRAVEQPSISWGKKFKNRLKARNDAAT